VLSISDVQMWKWFTLLSFRPEAEIAQLKAEVAAGRNPKEAKVLLAKEITTRFHSAAAAEAAHEDFQRRASGGVPDEVPEVSLAVRPCPSAPCSSRPGWRPAPAKPCAWSNRAACASTARWSATRPEGRCRDLRGAGRQAQVRTGDALA
jgi:tyrosyl-tRNA synthetase